ncbi:copper amine oxidase N-terminal domain-containing protein [Brevibacillus laterosporus]|uniref:copper amine oxidase N-terminal domain-containing protein n=1 Tax=Brevibacillus laterosporus TaxID=1465 RepID=UPI001CA5771C|nr:copper amine oxidase N-terminal domain-containing protein [Brevibacillus laterosporus]MED1665028.1 copper amine oxidase N-terminal domain-containing protein [Brevibacillus laterosporus]MED1668761.1 copper amine oxidase N-terminal domain-containing protein [Brevibacillus laterosporus]MED1716362.1 copper amine oxidase N-terminal domain-containing protein [Brevibacillus laterosporus]
MKRFQTIVAIVLAVVFMFTTMGISQAEAVEGTLIIKEPVYYQPQLLEVISNKDGSITGEVMVDSRYAASVILQVSDGTGEVIREIELVNESKKGIQAPSGIKKKISTNTKLLRVDGELRSVNVTIISFTVPAKILELSPNEYEVSVETSNTVVKMEHTEYQYSEKQTIGIQGGKVLTTSFPVSFPGALEMDKDGKFIITLNLTSIYDKSTFYLVVMDEKSRQVKRIKLKTKQRTISSKGLNLDTGTYTIYIEVSDVKGSANSNRVTLVIPDSSKVISGDDDFPGYVKVSEDGMITINLKITSEYQKAKFNVVIKNDNGKIVKRIPISTKNSKISTKGLTLSSGNYEILLEMVLQGKKYYSSAASWSYGTSRVFSVPTGQAFPGGIKVNTNGTITINLQWKSSYSSYHANVVVYDIYGDVVKRIPITDKNPMISYRELGLSTGGYNIVIEIVDPDSEMSASTLPTFIPINQSKDIVIFIDGELQVFKKAPVEINGRTLVPLRAIFEALGARVDWDEATQTVTAMKDGTTIKLTIGSKVAYKNGKKLNLDVPAQLFNGDTTMVPIRFVSEALGAKVTWDGYSNAVIISND